MENQILETDFFEMAVDVNHVLQGMVEVHVIVACIDQCRNSPAIILALQVLDILRKPQGKAIVPWIQGQRQQLAVYYVLTLNYPNEAKIHVAKTGRVARRRFEANIFVIRVPH